VDVSRFTALSARLDPEDVHEACGEANRSTAGTAAAASGWPHFLQKRLPAALAVPHG
jgi:hypothetical protein